MFFGRMKDFRMPGSLRWKFRGANRKDGVKAGSEKMADIYSKAEDHMKTKKPFLDFDFSISDLSSAIFTNKTYLSRTINQFAETNFPQYINSHRVEYALELMRRDPYLTVKEVAGMSGFGNPVSFNDAFKRVTGDTPGAYIKRIRSGR